MNVMFTDAEITAVRTAVSEVLNTSFDGLEIQIEEGPGLTVAEQDSRFLIRAESKIALARGFFRLMQERAAGRRPVSVQEEKHFRSCGSFLDFSRNGVMTVEACRRYIANSAALGLDAVVVYTEDTYTVPEYPYMGYLRGRLTPEEYRALDEYANSLGVELIPCIQTLAHMGNFLQWPAHQKMKDQPTILMCDEEETYAFIEAQVRAVRSYVRGKRLHIRVRPGPPAQDPGKKGVEGGCLLPQGLQEGHRQHGSLELFRLNRPQSDAGGEGSFCDREHSCPPFCMFRFIFPILARFAGIVKSRYTKKSFPRRRVFIQKHLDKRRIPAYNHQRVSKR